MPGTGLGSNTNTPILGASELGERPTDATSDTRGRGQESTQQRESESEAIGKETSDTLGRLSKKTAKEIRKQCLELLANKTDKQMTEEDKALLRQYEGAGGLNEGGQTTRAVLSEFYTPRDVIAKVWELVDKYNHNQNKTVIEPSSGIGRFAENRTEKFTLCEIDETSARIAGILHPKAEIKQGAFQNLFVKNNVPQKEYKGAKYDVAIGNPPYGDYNGLYKGLGEGKNHTRYEEYFIDRTLDTLKDGGIMAFVMPSGFLRGKESKAKEIIASKGKLQEAWRLPKGTFSSTDIGTDIVIIKKEKGDIKDFSNNAYFNKNENHVIGTETDGGNWGTKIIKCPDGKTIEQAIQMIDVNATSVEQEAKQIEGTVETKIDTSIIKKPTIIGTLKVGARFIKDGEEGSVTYITDTGAVGYKLNNGGMGRVTKADIEVTRTTKTALEIHENRSQAMLGNDNAKKAFHKEQQEKAKKGDIFQASIGKNMTADEFNTKYCGKKIPKEDLRYWQVMKYDNTIDTTKLSKNEIAELEKNKNFIKDENSNWTSTVMYASGNIYDKLEQLEDNKDNITQEEYKEKKAILEAVLPAKRKVGEFTITPTENIADDIICENGRPLNKEFLHWLNRNSVVEDELTSYDLTKQDIADFVRQRPVRTERGFDKETEKMRAQTKRAKRRDVAISLFNEFLAEDLDDETKKKLEDEYNKRYNAIVNPDYKKMPLFVEGMNTHKGDKEFNLTEQQIQGVTELCNRGTGILAYDVGVGKTVTGLIATVNQMQTGKSKRPLICVPKSVYKNWIASAKQHFPDVKINELGNFGDKFLDRYKDEQGKINLPENAINICTYQALEKITFNEATLNGDLRRDLLESQSAADYDRNGNRIEDTRTEKQIKAEIEKIETLLGVGAKAKEGAIDWEQFGFDNITVDEVHNFKNIFMIPRERNKSSLESDMTIDRYGNTVKEKEEQLANEYKGISGATSARGIKMFCISQLVQKKQNGRGFLGLSATPFNNSPVEIYNILSLVARDELKRQHIYNLQDFMKKFAELKNDWKVDAKGDVESVQVMKNFKCLPDLQALITRYIDKVDGEEAGVVRPYKRVHTPELDLTPLQKAIMQAEMARMDGEFTRANDSGADKAGANTGDVLVAMNNMRMATLSPTLIDPKFYADYRKYGITSMPNPKDIVKESPKLKFVCDCCTKQYKTRPTEGQVIYMPRGVKQFEYVKDYLVKQGIDASAVAFLRPGINDDKKEEIMNDFNNPEGKIKIIIGSETIKEGVNLNGNSTVLYNTMLGWNPTETTQVEGRIWRQGNRQGVTHIVYPLMNDSIDSMMYQKYDEKSSRLNDLWSYKGDSLNVEDIDPEEIKFELIKDPQKRADMKIKQQKAQVEADLRMLNVQYDKIVKWQSEAKSLQQSFEKEVSPDAWDDRITNMRSQVMLYSHMLAEIKKYAGKKEYKDKGISEIPQLKDKLDAISYGYGSNYYTVDETIQKYQQIIKDAQSYLNNKQKELQKLKENLSKQGCNDDTATDKKLNAISQKRQELNKQLDEIINNRENLIEQAKKDIARQQASQKHVSLENQIQNYSSAISGDLRDFSKVKSAIDLLKTYTPQQIQEVINTVRQQGSCKLGDDTLTEKELKDLQKYKDRAVIKKSLCFIYKGRLWVKNEAWGGVRYV